ncbi:MAG: hypothetical protein ABSA93_16075 [Streptosporangiaceae bacterium]
MIDNGRHRPRAGILAATANHGPGSAGGTMLAFSPGGTFAVGDEKASTFIWNVNGLR